MPRSIVLNGVFGQTHDVFSSVVLKNEAHIVHGGLAAPVIEHVLALDVHAALRIPSQMRVY